MCYTLPQFECSHVGDGAQFSPTCQCAEHFSVRKINRVCQPCRPAKVAGLINERLKLAEQKSNAELGFRQQCGKMAAAPNNNNVQEVLTNGGFHEIRIFVDGSGLANCEFPELGNFTESGLTNDGFLEIGDCAAQRVELEAKIRAISIELAKYEEK